MIVRLKVGTNQYFIVFTGNKIVLSCFNITMHINVPNIRTVDGTCGIFIMKCARIGKPTPGTFLRHTISFINIDSVSQNLQISGLYMLKTRIQYKNKYQTKTENEFIILHFINLKYSGLLRIKYTPNLNITRINSGQKQ